MIQNTFLLLLLLYCLLSSNFFHRHTFGVFSFSLLLLFHMYILYYNTDASSCVRRVLGTRILCEQYNIDNMTSSLVANFCFNQSSINHHYFFVNPLFTTVLVCCWLFHTVERKEIFFINHHHSSCSTTTTNSVDPPLWQIASFTRPVFYSYLSDFYHPNVRMYGDGPIIIHLHHRHPQTHQC